MDIQEKNLHFITHSSSIAGPIVWLTAGIHGDEPGGPAIIREIFKRLKKNPLRCGTLYAFPALNPEGLKKRTRTLPESNEDINRAFPGNPRGTPAEKRASYIFQKITATKPALVLDLHNDWKNSVPYLLLDPPLQPHHKKAYAILKTLAHQSGYPAVQERKEDMKELKKSLSGGLMYSGIPASTCELGDASKTNKKNIHESATIIWNLLAAFKMVRPLPEEKPSFTMPREYKNKTLRYSDIPKTHTAGRIQFFIKSGQIIQKGGVIAKIFSKKGEVKEILYARNSGIVLGCTDEKNISRDSIVAAFGTKINKR